jgi:hypothetical protein
VNSMDVNVKEGGIINNIMFPLGFFFSNQRCLFIFKALAEIEVVPVGLDLAVVVLDLVIVVVLVPVIAPTVEIVLDVIRFCFPISIASVL